MKADDEDIHMTRGVLAAAKVSSSQRIHRYLEARKITLRDTPVTSADPHPE